MKKVRVIGERAKNSPLFGKVGEVECHAPELDAFQFLVRFEQYGLSISFHKDEVEEVDIYTHSSNDF